VVQYLELVVKKSACTELTGPKKVMKAQNATHEKPDVG
jgi:hypothetical protein